MPLPDTFMVKPERYRKKQTMDDWPVGAVLHVPDPTRKNPLKGGF
jgi:hypothetical protein